MLCCECLTACVLKCILSLINTLFLITGLLLSAAGGILLGFASNKVFSRSLLNMIDDILKNFQIIDSSTQGDINRIDLVEVLRPAGAAILVVGLFITAVAIIGYCGLNCYDIILKLYLIILIVILVVEIAIVSVFFSHALDSKLQSKMIEVIDDHYVDIDDYSFYSIVPNLIMIGLNCCGVNNYTDFNSAKLWNRTRELVIDQQKVNVTLITPAACCKTRGAFPQVSVIDQHCADRPNDNISNWNSGCWNVVQDSVDRYRTYAILISIAIMIVEVLLILGVIIIIKAD